MNSQEKSEPVASHYSKRYFVQIGLIAHLQKMHWDTFTLKVPRWLYDYFSLGVFIIN